MSEQEINETCTRIERAQHDPSNLEATCEIDSVDSIDSNLRAAQEAILDCEFFGISAADEEAHERCPLCKDALLDDVCELCACKHKFHGGCLMEDDGYCLYRRCPCCKGE